MPEKINKKNQVEFWQKTPIHITLVIIAFIWTLPTMGLFISSLRQREAMLSSGWWSVFLHPFELTQYHLGNYLEVIQSQGMGQAFLNSLTISIPATIIPIAIATFAAYGFAWMEFPGRQFLFLIVVCLLVVPLQTTLIPILRAYRDLGLANTFLGVWLAHTGYGLPLGIYLLRNYIGALPRDLIEAAKVDGASHLKIFTRLIVPLSMPAIASFAVFQFLWVWNDINFYEEKRLHPTQKPVKLIERIIRASSHENMIVLDPFMGSGSTVALVGSWSTINSRVAFCWEISCFLR